MIGQTISHYQILEKLGEGGMGVVYKARDTKLDRDVALKFLPAHAAASGPDRARFMQEAKAAAALNHQNVCSVIDIQEHEASDGGGAQLFIVMEYVDGQTLRARKAALNAAKAIDIGIQIAEGLAAAHEKGIVHRDIKPENIMIRKDGVALIMDFGLAKLRASGSKITQLTKAGSTVGTAGYMSPEQVQGQEADHRSDVFSFGVLLYELLAGEMPFKGVHETALMYEIVNVDPAPMSTVNTELDPELDRIVLECLQKEPDERYHSIRDVVKELKRFKRESSRARVSRITAARPVVAPTRQGGAGDGLSSASRVAGGRGLDEEDRSGGSRHPSLAKRLLWPAVAGILALALAAVLILKPGGDAAGSGAGMPVMRFPVMLEVSSPLVLGAATLSIAPDGRNMVYLAGSGLAPQLFLRPLDRIEAKAMAGSEGASDPFFSADGQSVAFFASGKLKRLSLFGGAAQDICEVRGFMRGGWWDGDGAVWFGHLNRGIFRVAAVGGDPEEVTTLDSAKGEISHRFPQPLPGGKWVLYTAKFNNITSFDDAVIAAQNIETHERRELVRGGSYGRYLPEGYIMYARGTTIYGVPFDAERLEVTGPPIPLVEGGMLNQLSGTANYDVARNGIMIYTPIGPTSDLNTLIVWMDRAGAVDTLFREARPYDNARLSPDNSKIAVTIRAANDDVWVYDVERRTMTRLTFGGGNSDLPVWMPDGRRIVLYTERGRMTIPIIRSSDGTGSTVPITVGDDGNTISGGFAVTITPDGGRLLYSAGGDIRTVSPGESTGSASLLKTAAFEDAPRLSPDGRLLAYASDETGRFEIYVTPYPALDGKWQISTGGPIGGPIWSPDSRELYYAEGDHLMAVTVTREAAVRFSSPRKVCRLPESTFSVYDIAKDGRRFLVGISERRRVQATQVNVVTGWFEEMGRKFAAIKR